MLTGSHLGVGRISGSPDYAVAAADTFCPKRERPAYATRSRCRDARPSQSRSPGECTTGSQGQKDEKRPLSGPFLYRQMCRYRLMRESHTMMW